MSNQHVSAIHRRGFLGMLGGVGLFHVLGAGMPSVRAAARPGRLKQAVCQGVFKGIKLDLDGMCREAARLGIQGIDLVGPSAFPTLKKYGLVPTMVPGGSGIKSGINDRNNHAEIDRKMREAIEAASAAGAPNVIVLAGDRQGITDEQGMENSVRFLNNIKALAEDKRVTLCIELLNSKVNHPGYMADRTAWGAAVCKQVNSPRVKLLYDIYHMQIMEGDIIRTIRDNIQHIGHFHTAGNPGRHEFDETQEIYYPPICKAIADLGFTGYLAHEYTPTRQPLETLEKMLRICDV
ncbi:MAG TPA: TIM barrel protein [Candidatus Paceibacterota bacterium]|nr:TIM barrel protein [Verrucomicrobiota bacterium]HRZ45377.1 TIM barrel protein [Candidatus Paceibacterota bacterium]